MRGMTVIEALAELKFFERFLSQQRVSELAKRYGIPEEAVVVGLEAEMPEHLFADIAELIRLRGLRRQNGEVLLGAFGTFNSCFSSPARLVADLNVKLNEKLGDQRDTCKRCWIVPILSLRPLSCRGGSGSSASMSSELIRSAGCSP
jgi:hypothetical protein